MKLKVPNEKRKGLFFVMGAVACGLVAALFILGLGNKIAPKVPALEAVVEIAPGDPLDRSQFREIKLPEAGLPREIIHPGTDLSGMIASRGMYPGDILRHPSAISLEGDSPSLLSARLKALENPELRGVEIPVDSIKGMLTGMKTMDMVDIVAVYKEYDARLDDEVLVSRTIVQAAPVIGLRGGETDRISSAAENSVVVALTQDQVELYALHMEKGKIYASLRPFGEQRQVESKGVKEIVQIGGNSCTTGDC